MRPTALPARGTAPAPVRVMICDDSITIRGAIARMLDGDPEIAVVARVANGRAALDELARNRVEIVVLDIEMPIMDGMTALPLLLKANPSLGVIMASTLTTRGADIAMRALRLGAADYVPKPSVAEINDDSFRRELVAKIKGLARLRRRTAKPHAAPAPGAATVTLRAAAARAPLLLAIGSSTGGPQALFTVVQGLGRRIGIPVVLTQHMPPTFTSILAEHLSRLGGMRCAEAKDGEPLLADHLYVAPGDRHLLVHGTQTELRAKLSADPPENFCRPSVDPMLRSAVAVAGGRILVAMLTGMGHDGLAGTRLVVEAGGTAIAQDEATSVVWGMPGAVANAGLCYKVLPIDAIAPDITALLKRAPA
jgi:two-component system, chemotaxis family, protein-glutamate methylesterase/glutaminase